MIDQTFSKRKITCWAEIDGQEYDIVQFSADFALNTIPTASVTLALGRDVTKTESTGFYGRAANINEKFLFRYPVKVFATSLIQAESPDLAYFNVSVPQFYKKVIFSGYIAGFGFQRTSSSAVLTLSVEHWLADLAASTMLSSATHYSTPSDLQRSALYRDPGTEPYTLKGQSSLMAESWILYQTGGPNQVCLDLWETGIKRILVAAANSDNLADLHDEANVFGGGEKGCDTAANKKTLNKVALNALDKVTSKNAKLSIRTGDASPLDLGGNIFADLSSLYLENLAGQTMWDCLISSSGNFMFAIAPGIDIAQVVPYCPTVSKSEPFKTIPANQIDSVSISGDCPRTLRGVALVQPQEGTVLNENGDPPTGIPAVSLGGVYISPSAGCSGVVLFKHPPSWLCIRSNTWEKSDLPPDTTIAPKEPGTNSAQKKDAELASIRNSYAKALFGVEVTKGRQGTISGPLRFDIGPGSFIKFELPGEAHMPDTGDNRYFYGIVVRVSCVIDSNSATASTTYTVAHVRTNAEENDKGFVMTEHPIYTTTWFGSALDEQLK